MKLEKDRYYQASSKYNDDIYRIKVTDYFYLDGSPYVRQGPGDYARQRVKCLFRLNNDTDIREQTIETDEKWTEITEVDFHRNI